MRFTLNGVSPRNTHAFLREVDAVVDRDYGRVFDALVEQSELEVDDPLDLFDEPFSQPVRLPKRWWSHNEKRFETKTKRNAKFPSKRKEVK